MVAQWNHYCLIQISLSLKKVEAKQFSSPSKRKFVVGLRKNNEICKTNHCCFYYSHFRIEYFCSNKANFVYRTFCEKNISSYTQNRWNFSSKKKKIMSPLIGVLALQGAFAEHQRCLEEVGCRTVQVGKTGVDRILLETAELLK